MPEPTDHRATAERWLHQAEQVHVGDDATEFALIAMDHYLGAIHDALLAGQVGPSDTMARTQWFPIDENEDLCGFAQGTNRCVRTDGHTGIHHLARDHA